MSLRMPTSFPVACHTDFVTHGTTFVAIQGYKQDGTAYIMQALNKGATTIVVAKDAILDPATSVAIAEKKAELVYVDDTRLALAQLSAQAAEYPAKKLHIIGVTGTKGKTTTSFLLEHIFKKAGYKTALLSTVHNTIDDVIFPAPLTTAQPDYLHQFLKLCVATDVQMVIMEVAAQALSLHRVEDIFFDGVIFTNFSPTHAEFYPTVTDYLQAKLRLFEHRKKDAPLIINLDDEVCKQHIPADNHVTTISLTNADAAYVFTLKQEAPSLQGVITAGHERTEIACPALLGAYNGYNLTAAAAMAHALGISFEHIAQALLTFEGVPGRMTRYYLANGAMCIIDYAHNPSSFEQLFTVLSSITDHLILVFGAGGERDRTMRPIMGSIAARFAHNIFLTTDNPRSENPASIIADIMQGIDAAQRSKVTIELDREQAIKKAYKASKPTSIIALLGKGPEEYQIIGTAKQYFSEASIVKGLCNQ